MRFLIFLLAAGAFIFYPATAIQAQAPVFGLRPALPLFLRPGDRLELPFTLTNKSTTERTGQAELQLKDATTNTSVDGWFQNFFPVQYFTAAANNSATVKFPVEVPYSFFKTAHWRFYARAGKDSAVTSGMLPVLPARNLISENALQKGNGTLLLPGLLKSEDTEGLLHASVQVQLAASPALFGYAALPFLLQADANQLNAVANQLFAAALLLKWVGQQPNAAQSVLSKATKAQAPEELQRQLSAAINLLVQQQQKNGAYPWWLNGPADVNTTRYVVLSVGRLLQLQALPQKDAARLQAAAKKALLFLKKSKSPIADVELAYLESLFHQPGKVKAPNLVTASLGQAPRAEQAMVAMQLLHQGDSAAAKRMLQLLFRQRTTENDVAYSSLWSNDATGAALLLEAAHMGADNAVADSATTQLLQYRGAQGWPTPESTTAAVFALLRHYGLPATPLPAVQVQLGNLPTRTVLSGNFYYTTTVEAGLVHPALGNVAIQQESSEPVYALAHWQYFGDPAPNQPRLAMERQWKGIKNGEAQTLFDGSAVSLGDTVEVQLAIASEEPIANVRVEEGLPAGFMLLPPSGLFKTDKGIGQTERPGTKEWRTMQLPAGGTVFTYRMKATHAGTFQSGPAALWPQFGAGPLARVEGIRISVE